MVKSEKIIWAEKEKEKEKEKLGYFTSMVWITDGRMNVIINVEFYNAIDWLFIMIEPFSI